MTEKFLDPVALTTGPAYDDHDIIERTSLPDDAFQTALIATLGEGENAQTIEVWAIERPFGDDDF